ncbi:uncharacterized protein Z518_10085 [Rhinocladiella mackenziei CBS 650.93]|uniref:Rhinocladiella mackenziei CBS 650.93 unplaced genomic scaffold supercont1.8, whole genome shotgun sequence n=1 Tax=Rhinocladiella mackenziei CBS 650.93 TaxID=1442369 RepID=A0A0D2I5H7_9EURO|nr:uncharacterized protein Z518_10085 [Rhinocladiella mackenziei CBS 650.93]KIX01019.1 hypothetical protein Z518_10085 [Rhinocladiella mackenziei CBS 650.93]
MFDVAKTKESSLWANRKCLLICCVVAIANMQYGFDTAAVGGLQAMPGFLKVFGYPSDKSPTGYGIDPTFQQLISSLLTLGSFLSSLLAGFFGSYFGRKHAIWLACALNAVACAIQIATTSKGVIYLGRLLLGIANGFLVTFSNVYTAEASPAHLRGVIVALFAFWVNIGSILGSTVNNFTKRRMDKASYQIPLGCLYIVPTILAIGLCFVPESPRFLLHHGKEARAKKSLIQLRGSALTNEELEIEWAEMLLGMEEEKKNVVSVGWIDMFRGTDLRRTLLCYGMIACQSASGIWFLIAYQTYFLQQGGVTKAFEYTIMTTCMGFVGVNVGMFAMRHLLGRRSILMIGATACGLSQLSTAITASVSPNPQTTANVLTAFTALFKFFYNACVGAASYPVATEVVSTRLRAWTVGTATALGYILAWLVSFCSPYFINPAELGWGVQYGYIWAGSNFACVVFFFFFMPEMKGRTLEELDELFLNRVSVWDFPKYQCHLRQDAANDVRIKRNEEENKGLGIDKDGSATHAEEVQVMKDKMEK